MHYRQSGIDKNYGSASTVTTQVVDCKSWNNPRLLAHPSATRYALFMVSPELHQHRAAAGRLGGLARGGAKRRPSAHYQRAARIRWSRARMKPSADDLLRQAAIYYAYGSPPRPPSNPNAVALGKLKSLAKARAAHKNGARGGRPTQGTQFNRAD